MQDLISIIVPIYNTEKYLERCICSIINQTYKNLEIILINDGSTDNSLEICNKFKCIDRRIIVINKENGGQGESRNLGLDIAKGKYIGFVDSDDWIELNMYEKLIKNLKLTKSDISCCDTVNPKYKNTYEPKCNNIITFNNYEGLLKHLESYGGLDQCPVNKLYKKELFTNVRFLKLTGYEDAGTIFKLFINSNKVVYESLPLYNYFYRENSTMTREFSEKDYDRIKAYEEMEKVLTEIDTYKELVFYATNYKLGAIFYVVGEAMNRNKSCYLKMIKNIRNECRYIIKYKKYNTIKQKIILYLISTMPSFYGEIYKIKRNANKNK